MVDRRTGYLLNHSGLWRTADGGRRFAKIPLPHGTGAVGRSFVTSHFGYVETQSGSGCPDGPICRDALLVTRDGGRHFVRVGALPVAAIWSIAFVRRQVGYGVGPCPAKCRGGYTLWGTSDAGRHWQPLKNAGLPQSASISGSPGGYVALFGRSGFAVLVPGTGWRVVRVFMAGRNSGSGAFVPQPPVSVAPDRKGALVLIPGIGPMRAGYDAATWSRP